MPTLDAAQVGPTIVVVGHGMVGHRMVQELRRRPELSNHRIVVFGDEPTDPYDRVHLCRVLRGEEPKAVSLVENNWYDEQRVEVVRGDPVVHIDRERCFVSSRSGLKERYDHLILATGASPVLGKIPGVDGPRVRPLRSVDDAVEIRGRALLSRDHGRPVVVIGGGLLGLEVADELTRLDVTVHVLESADYPLSRQLERGAGRALLPALDRPGLQLHLGVRVQAIEDHAESALVALADGRKLPAGLVVPAMGIRPRDQLAREAQLPCDLFGGVEVDDRLLTRDPRISAVGECARHRGVVYGLVAPGYAMAEQVARRLAGEKVRFGGVDVGTRLKVRGVELSVLGQSAASGPWVKPIVYEADGRYRRLVVRRGKLLGLTCLGPWDELAKAQEALARGERLKPRQLERFARNETTWPKPATSIRSWPDEAVVCTCMGVTAGTLKKLTVEGVVSFDELSSRTGASTVCGTCRPLLEELERPEATTPRVSRPLVVISALSVLGAIAYLLLPPVPIRESVQATSIDVLYRDETLKQMTGFTLAGLFALSLVFSMRKRLRLFAFGHFEAWRVAHAFIGMLCLVGAFAHTGFRLGVQLDRALLLVFLGSTFLGGVAGGWSLLERFVRPEQAQTLRGWLVRSHIYLLWPLPVLLGAHVLKVYFF